MHSSLVRAQNAFGLLSTVLTVLACLIAATDLLHERAPSATIKSVGVQVNRGRPHHYSRKKEEFASVRFDLDADLSSLFTWNTKQVFVYVTAEWEDNGKAVQNATDPANVAVIWDSIITSPSSDYLANLGPMAMKKLLRSAAGKRIDPSRGNIHIHNQRPKYPITHPNGKIAKTKELRLRVHYNVQPWVGMLSWNQHASSSGNGIASWLLPQRGGAGSPRWAPLAGGESVSFDVPALAERKRSSSMQRGETTARASP